MGWSAGEFVNEFHPIGRILRSFMRETKERYQ